jgi:hypothetical protein
MRTKIIVDQVFTIPPHGAMMKWDTYHGTYIQKYSVLAIFTCWGKNWALIILGE